MGKKKDKLLIKLPGVHRRSKRLDEVKEKQKKPSSADRVQWLRERTKQDPQKLAKQKLKKKEENKKYKAKLKARRQTDKTFDAEYTKQQNKWQQYSRKKQARKKANNAARQKAKNAAKAKAIEKAKENKKRMMNRNEKKTSSSSGCSRKTVYRTRKHLEKLQNTSPETWSKVVRNVIEAGTPARRKNLLKRLQQTPASVRNILEVNKVGRPKKLFSAAKKKLMQNSESSVTGQAKVRNRYLLRKATQENTLKKPDAYHQQWKDKIEKFLNENSKSYAKQKRHHNHQRKNCCKAASSLYKTPGLQKVQRRKS